MTKSIKLVSTVTPQRLSFFGGGTDLPDYYLKHGGAVLSTTIDKYIYVTVKKHSPLFNEMYRLNYSITEHVDNLEDIKNLIARECLRFLNIDPPIYIATYSDLPAMSGLASSSCFAVGLLNALHIFKGEHITAGQLAEEACHIEIDILKNPIGKQDQYSVACGGFNFFEFHKEGRITLEPIVVSSAKINALFENSLLFWTGIQRDANVILSDQKSNIDQSLVYLDQLKNMAYGVKDNILSSAFDINYFGQTLDDSWRAKKSLSTKISNSFIDINYELAKKSGAIGGKILGAGGGGFMFLIVPKAKQSNVIKNLKEMMHIPISYESKGSALLNIF